MKQRLKLGLEDKSRIEIEQELKTDLFLQLNNAYLQMPLAGELEEKDITAVISILFCDEEEIKKLNKNYRQQDQVTDVLSFPALAASKGALTEKINPWDLEIMAEKKYLSLGDIAICLPRAKEQASEADRSLQEEVLLLAVHGALHLFGFDHASEDEEKEMFQRQAEILTLKQNKFKAGYVAILGRPNVGKSTLINHLIGNKIAIISPKPQTTRKMIRGVYNDHEAQIVFLDTPGLHRAKNRLGQHMLKEAEQALLAADLILLMIEASFRPFIDDLERQLLDRAIKLDKKVILIINKIDTARKDALLPLIDIYSKNFTISSFVPLSAKTGDGIDLLIAEIKRELPLSSPLYDEEDYSDQTERMLSAELIRETMLYLLSEELPYGTAVMIESFEEVNNEAGERERVKIGAAILSERDSHKRIILGKNGAMIKNIGIRSREKIAEMLDCPTDLNLFVKVRQDWRNKIQHLKELDFNN